MTKKQLAIAEKESVLNLLQLRFNKQKERHAPLKWADIQTRLEQNPEKLWSLCQMEQSGGEPDLLQYDKAEDAYVFCDFSKESPKERRSLCYDREALEARKKFKPENNAADVAAEMGVKLMNEAEYRKLQTLGNFDTTTSSWLATPDPIRKLGGAIFGDRRYNHVFIYHNGAESYYAARGFRGILRV